jgi:mono/diheme cytochrome c family protein
MRRIIGVLLLLAVAGLAVFWVLTRPAPLGSDAIAGRSGDSARGALVFHAGGCASCHAAPGARDEAKLVMAGGRRFESPFGTFVAPNISPDPEHGIGDWSTLDLVNAMLRGVSPSGAHYYPAFPYTSYARASVQDAVDLKAYLDTLPADATPNAPHELGFPFNIRRTLGVWKALFADDDWIVPDAGLSEAALRGRYLVEGLGHCGECHTPRNALGGPDRAAWLAGAPNPTGQGTIPDLRPGALTWSEGEIVEYLTSGFTPEYDTAGGEMAEVVENMAQLPAPDREAIAAYLKALPAAE